MMFHQFKKNKKRRPHRKFFIGNHEYRIWRAIQKDPVKLEGLMNPTSDMQLDKYWDEVVYYEGETPGVSFAYNIATAHYFTNGNTSNAISGENQATAMIQKNYMSSIAGHSHLYDIAFRTRANGAKMAGLVCGWLSPERPDFVGQGVERWMAGVTELNNIENGMFEPKFIALSTLMKEYG
jgi:hypothetical protein